MLSSCARPDPSTALRASYAGAPVPTRLRTRAFVPHGFILVSPQPHAHDFALMGEVQAEVSLIAIPQPNKFPVAVLVASFTARRIWTRPFSFGRQAETLTRASTPVTRNSSAESCATRPAHDDLLSPALFRRHRTGGIRKRPSTAICRNRAMTAPCLPLQPQSSICRRKFNRAISRSMGEIST